MKTFRKSSLLKLNRVLAGLLLAPMLILTGCDRQRVGQNGGPSSGRAAETTAFWEAFKKAATQGTGVEILSQPTWEKDVTSAEMCGVLGDIAVAERMRSRAITALPVLHVDPDLAQYAARYSAARVDVAQVCDEFVNLAQQEAETTSLPNFGLGLFFNMLERRNEKESGIFWRALGDQVDQTAKDVHALKPAAKTWLQTLNTTVGNLLRLQSDQMTVRVKLSQRFGKEFPAFNANTIETYGVKPDRAPSPDTMKKALVGHSIDEWSFDSVDEFVTFNVLYVTNRSDVLTGCIIKTHVKGVRSAEEHDFRLNVTYGRLYTRWKLLHVQVQQGN